MAISVPIVLVAGACFLYGLLALNCDPYLYVTLLQGFLHPLKSSCVLETTSRVGHSSPAPATQNVEPHGSQLTFSGSWVLYKY